MDKKKLRHEMLERRMALAPSLRADAAQKIKTLFLDNPVLMKAEVLSAYHAIRGELDPHFLITALQEVGKQIALPIIKDNRLSFCAYEKGDGLVAGAFGILEPKRKKIISPQLVLLPCLAFDKNGARLGYGAGHYDRALAELKVLKVALAFACQELPALPKEPHDIALDGALTEEGVKFFG